MFNYSAIWNAYHYYIYHFQYNHTLGGSARDAGPSPPIRKHQKGICLLLGMLFERNAAEGTLKDIRIWSQKIGCYSSVERTGSKTILFDQVIAGATRKRALRPETKKVKMRILVCCCRLPRSPRGLAKGMVEKSGTLLLLSSSTGAHPTSWL